MEIKKYKIALKAGGECFFTTENNKDCLRFDWEDVGNLISEHDELRAKLASMEAEISELRAYKESAENQEPVAWGAFYFGGKYRGQLYSHDSTEEKIDDYIAYVHRSNDSITLQKGPLFTNPVPAAKPSHWAVINPGRADQYRAESVAVRKELGFSSDSDEVAPIDLLSAIRQIRADRSRITEQDAREILDAYWCSTDDCVDWVKGEDCQSLLNRLNADREQLPAVAVPDAIQPLQRVSASTVDKPADDNGTGNVLWSDSHSEDEILEDHSDNVLFDVVANLWEDIRCLREDKPAVAVLVGALERIANMDSMSYHSLESARIVARKALAANRKDPAVSERFRPIKSKQELQRDELEELLSEYSFDIGEDYSKAADAILSRYTLEHSHDNQ